MGLFEGLLTGLPPCQPIDFHLLAVERLSHGLEPIDWPKIISNQLRAEALTRQLTIYEKLLYKGAIQAFNEAQDNAERI